MPGTTVAAIVASLHGRSGKTLLARVIAEHFILSGGKPLMFDTDAIERRLTACFPYDAVVLDLSRVRGQMALFDTLARPFAAHRVVDVSQPAFRKFFELMRLTDFAAEAKAHGVQPAIFYILDRDHDSIAEAAELNERFPDCALVLVDNAFLPRPSPAARESAAWRALAAHPLRILMPTLHPALVEAIDGPAVSLSALMREPLSRSEAPRGDGALSFEARASLRVWLVRLFRDIHRVLRAVEAGARSPDAAQHEVVRR